MFRIGLVKDAFTRIDGKGEMAKKEDLIDYCMSAWGASRRVVLEYISVASKQLGFKEEKGIFKKREDIQQAKINGI